MISTMFTLISGVGVLLVGRLGDIFGRRYFLIGGQLLGLVGSLVCATAKNIPTVIVGSSLCGLSAAVQLTFTFVIAELVPNRVRPLVNGGIFITTFPFAAFGGLIAQLFITRTKMSWRWNYYLNIITCGLSLILFILCYFPPGWEAKRNSNKFDELKSFDFVGLALYGAGLVLLLLGLSWGGSSYSWSSAHVICAIVIGLVMLLLFVSYEFFMPLKQPLLPMSLLKQRTYSATVCAALVGNMVYFSFSLLWPQEISSIFATDGIEAGWLSISTGTGLILGEILAGFMMKPLGNSKLQLIISTVVITAFSGAMAALNPSRLACGIAFTGLGGLATGYLELITLIMCPLYCKPEDIGLASGFLGSAKQVAGTIAAAIYVAILNNRVVVVLPEKISSAALESGLPQSSLNSLLEATSSGNAMAIGAVPGITDHIVQAVFTATRIAYADSFSTVFLVSILFGGLAVIATLASASVDDKLDNSVAAKLSCSWDSHNEILTGELELK
ncbi:hypothetical protein N7495_001412 [Penicillium taxi]|uniref:uncharacterized protein n=1 Tax=Penicillium taxi TaxID=168475 RepID=UPI0025459967|nr:uncharacterized protein N7495_001412 [Penicillium taxi]KAJ5908730.1 hypothetical protein N7495_001412 [Penicillium taxi]